MRLRSKFPIGMMIEYALQLLLSGKIYIQSTIFYMNDNDFSKYMFYLIQDSMTECFAGLINSQHTEIDFTKITAEETTS